MLTVHKCLLFEQFICWQGKSSMAAHPYLVARKLSYEQLGTRRTALVTKFGDSGDSARPCHNSNSAATTNNPRPRTARMSASLETTVEAGESLTGEPLRNPLPAKQRSSPTRPPWVRACASFLPQRVETRLRADNMLPQQPRVKLMCSPGRYYPLGGTAMPAMKVETCSPLAVMAAPRPRDARRPLFFPDCNPRP